MTYADTREGYRDRDKREFIREAAASALQRIPSGVAQWAFRITVLKTGRRRFDIENVPKLIIDSFCRRQLAADGSSWTRLGLYEDDTLDYVRLIEVMGEGSSSSDSTIVEIFGLRRL